ncbi:MAG TPA: type I 3-dehydroquinate dehydratase [Verrucomicrobiae bacterium]
MTASNVEFRTDTGALEIGRIPRVVGTLSSFDFAGDFCCDVVEVRLDRTNTQSDWLWRCKKIQSGGKPVLLTARLRAEGGNWLSDDSKREAVYAEALRELAAVDVELSSVFCGSVCAEAARLRKACVVSFHNFQETPPLADLCTIAEKGMTVGSIAKISTMINREEDVAVLKSLLGHLWPKPICVIGMGEAWAQTRVEFAALGSCLTYGYLDGSAAPGQWHAAELLRQVRAALPASAKT